MKNKNSWEQARMISYVVAQSNSTKPIKATDLIKFSWDNDDVEKGDTSVSSGEIERLKKKAEQYIKSK